MVVSRGGLPFFLTFLTILFQVNKRCRFLLEFEKEVQQKLHTVPLVDHPFYGQDVNSSSLGWAMSAASSRAFRLHGEVPMLLPLIDMCNHSFNPNARIVQERSVNSLDMSVKVSILSCSCTLKFSIFTLLKFLFQNQTIFFLFLISTSQMGMILSHCNFKPLQLPTALFPASSIVTMKISVFHELSNLTSACHLIHSFLTSLHNLQPPCISCVRHYSFPYTISMLDCTC